MAFLLLYILQKLVMIFFLSLGIRNFLPSMAKFKTEAWNGPQDNKHHNFSDEVQVISGIFGSVY